MPNQADYDPLLGALKKPAVSWKNEPVGTVRRFQVKSLSDEAQTTDFSTKQPAFWPPKPGQAQGDPKMAVVFDVFDEKEQEDRTLWCPKPSSMLTAVALAQQAAGQRIGPGGTLVIKFTGTKPSGKGEDQKLFEARYEPPAPGSNTPDPLTSSAPAQPAASSDPWSTPTSGDEPPF